MNKIVYMSSFKISYTDFIELFKKVKTKEEQEFYIVLSNIVLQREQERVIGKN